MVIMSQPNFPPSKWKCSNLQEETACVCICFLIYLFIYLFIHLFRERGTVRVRFLHWCCIKISYICQRCCSKIPPIWYIYIYICIPQNFIQLGHKNQNILHMHSEKLNSAINDSMSFSQWISERKFNFALLRHAQMIGLCLLLCCRFL